MQTQIFSDPLRAIRVIYDNGMDITTNMASHLTDDQMKSYFRIGKSFNVGCAGNDVITKVIETQIIY